MDVEIETPDGQLAVVGNSPQGFDEIVTPEAAVLLIQLERHFGQRRRDLLAARTARQAELNAGKELEFLAETAEIRSSDWTIAELPEDLRDRRVEITGPTSRKMIINALNSGARTFMADLEDSGCPTFANVIDGQINLRDANLRQIDFTDPTSGKAYALVKQPAVLLVRPRGWHLEEAHLRYEGQSLSGSLVDFGLYFFHNAKRLIASGSGPYFYLPKLESHLEARLWNDVFCFAQKALHIKQGTIRATVLIETIPAVFEMDEILYELREHSAGLNCGRWDYIFSIIKCHPSRPEFVMPDRDLVTMTVPNMRAYSQLTIKTCHRRNAPAMGGMAAFIPIKGDPKANNAVFAKVRADKTREANDGHDGTWVAHPGLVTLATEVFDSVLKGPNQIDKKRQDVSVTREELLSVPEGPISEAGIRQNFQIGVGYLSAWLGGVGCVPIFNMMEDAATAEISRAQLWQWRQHHVLLADGRRVDETLLRSIFTEEMQGMAAIFPDRTDLLKPAGELMDRLVFAKEFPEFLTHDAYQAILSKGM